MNVNTEFIAKRIAEEQGWTQTQILDCLADYHTFINSNGKKLPDEPALNRLLTLLERLGGPPQTKPYNYS